MRAILTAASAVLLAACSPAAPAPPEPQRYVVDFGEAWGGRLHYMAVVPCSDRPTSWESTFRLCNLDAVELLPVNAETWNAYDQGDPYPSVNP